MAEWIKATNYSQGYCSNCRLTPKTIFGRLPPYCPNCGKKMKNKEWIDNSQATAISTYSPECLEECKKFLGHKPHNTSTNVVLGDTYFLNQLYNKYGKDAVTESIRHLEEEC